MAVLLVAALGLANAPARAFGVITLDGQRDANYGPAIATDPSGDLASPGPRDWSGTAWADQTALYCQNDQSDLFIYVDLPQYSKAGSRGQIGLLIDRSTAAGGGQDP